MDILVLLQKLLPFTQSVIGRTKVWLYKSSTASFYLQHEQPSVGGAVLPALNTFRPRCHPLEKQLTQETNSFFLKNWPFTSEKAAQKFRAAGFGLVTCLYFPKAKDDRISFACRLLTLLFLIDDRLEDMSFAEGKMYNERIMQLFAGTHFPNREIPEEWISYDLWQEMRACDEDMANDILEPTFEFMRSQTDPARRAITSLGVYLRYRESDVGVRLLIALMWFTMELRLSSDERAALVGVDQNCAKHIAVVNDIYSWKKELQKSQETEAEGAVLCSSIKIVMDECGLDEAAAKRCLWAMCREWERVHMELTEQKAELGPVGREHCDCLLLQMSGNELWSQQTARYK